MHLILLLFCFYLANSFLFLTFAHMKRLLMMTTLVLVTLTGWAGNRIFTENVRSLTSIVNGDWMNRPVMELGSGDRLKIENSINTTVMYTHYWLTIPNDRCRLKMSGNYRLTVVDEDQDNEKVLEVEFYVVEPLMSVGLNVTSNTDVDHNDRHQQLSLTVNYNSVRVLNMDEEIRTVVMQNWREDQARHDVRPNFISGQGLTWEHNKALIFDAGNEFHKYEILDVSHTTMGLDRIAWNGQNYEAWPFAATVRKHYLTDVSAEGAFVIRNSDNREVDYTCDYVWVNYELVSPWQGDIYISGHWTTDSQRDHYHMKYDAEAGKYTARLMQKQGYYSYQFVSEDGSNPSSEGSFFQTQNRYQAFVYYKGTGARTWRLVGYRALDFR